MTTTVAAIQMFRRENREMTGEATPIAVTQRTGGSRGNNAELSFKKGAKRNEL